MKKALTIFTVLITVFLFQFCTKSEDTSALLIDDSGLTLPSTTLSYSVTYPAHIAADLILYDNTPTDNQITDNGATLGRVLFYDKQLSKNNSISCASCHKQANSFEDNIALSEGFEGGITTRKSMALLNVRFYKSGKMFWDERSSTLEKQTLQPIQNHIEMGLTLSELETKVKAKPYYASLFTKAFGSSSIDSVKIAKALSQFVRSIVTYQSKYDKVKQGLASFTTAEANGEELFLNAGNITCAACHTPPMFLTSSPAAGFGLADPNDTGINGSRRFKSTSLRNISIRTNLFHNGSVANVQTMLQSGATGNGIPQHSLNPQNTINMLAFLNTLTDNTILTEEKFSNPFKN
jgi:cytochrome c peroxidase